MNTTKELSEILLEDVSFWSKIRRRLYSKIYFLSFSVPEYEKYVSISRGDFRHARVESLQDLMNIKQSIVEHISEEKFASVHKRYTDQERDSDFWLLYTPEDELCGYAELVKKDFYDDTFRSWFIVPESSSFYVDLNIFPPFRSNRAGAQSVHMLLEHSRVLGKEVMLTLVDGGNPASMRNMHHMGGKRIGHFYKLLPYHVGICKYPKLQGGIGAIYDPRKVRKGRRTTRGQDNV